MNGMVLMADSENLEYKERKKSCGCIKSPDRTGEKFGKLTVVGRSDRRSKRGSRTVPLWKCRCDCGNEVYRAMDSLTTNKNCMCKACMNKEKTKKMWENAGRVEGTQIGKIRNMTLSAANTSGVRGVYLEKKTGHWRARIKFQGKIYSLGTYITFEEAVKARQRGEEEFFGHFLKGLENRNEI